ncbi:hypothetical protein ACW4EZ_17425 [Bacillus toyonensis]|uniref:hypothetical protein n=1 Tax=Bacillus cereus group TaxID=86661 RepID=UPI0001A0CE50|nr:MULTISPECIES: hypothetical protein [Bacillus cereus group]EEL33589.1 hypothetical protein bcere0019_31940 [Bacillus cereus Rock3-28]OTX32769.1 hypothetical protein BK717_18450 [Bacillus thuringiensis serovar malayensis]OUB08808.1 hypothetical protein BK709_08090 [Bacillus thuringiensis serovar shandongiensis]MBJ7944881.1 hypothetical protein [Bacillus cereus group sp. N24]MBJ8076439.1 hypothetical protein [Bacillus cereus group sp. N12]
MKKIGLTIMGLAVAGVVSLSIGGILAESKQEAHENFSILNLDTKQYAAHGDTPAPAKPDFLVVERV